MPQARKAKAKPAEPESTNLWITIEGKAYEIDPSDLNWGEIEEIELYFDCSVDEVDWDTGRGNMFMAYLARKRDDATFMLADMKRLKPKDVSVSDKPRPTEPASAVDGSQS